MVGIGEEQEQREKQELWKCRNCGIVGIRVVEIGRRGRVEKESVELWDSRNRGVVGKQEGWEQRQNRNRNCGIVRIDIRIEKEKQVEQSSDR